MKKIAKVILAAALVLLVAGAFTGAAAAVGPAAGAAHVLPAEIHIQGAAAQSAENNAVSSGEGANSAPILKVAQVVKKETMNKKIPVIPLTPLTPVIPPTPVTPRAPFTPPVPPFVHVISVVVR